MHLFNVESRKLALSGLNNNCLVEAKEVSGF